MKAPKRIVRAAAAAAAALGIVGILLGSSSGGSIDVFVGSTPTPAACAGFSFCDEFSDSTVDTSKWIVLNEHADTSNSEIGCYRPANTVESGGFLTETVKHETFTCASPSASNNYSLGAIQAKSFSFTYGTVVVRAETVGGVGPWPTIWLLGANCQAPTYLQSDGVGACDWPTPGSEEIDIAEYLSGNFANDCISLHSSVGDSSSCHAVTDASTHFHTYELDWSVGHLVFKVDGSTIDTFTSHVPSTPMFLIIDSTVGAAGGSITDGTLPQTTSIDYVHITS